MALRMYVSFAWRRRRWITNTIFYLSISSTSETRYPGIEVNKYKQTLWLKGRMTADVPAFFLKKHYVKSVRIRSYSGPHFPAFRLNTERCSVSLRILSECRIYVLKMAYSERIIKILFLWNQLKYLEALML